MDQSTLLNPALLTALISFLLLWSITKWFSKSSAKKNFPPSPPKLPIIGNFHQLGSAPHRSLLSLAKKYGPVMLLHLGSRPVLIVSSADAAQEIIKTHELSFSNRPETKVFRTLAYNFRDVSSTPYGEYWRQARSILVVQLLSSKRVQSFRPVREEEAALFIKKIRESPGPVNLSKLLLELSYDGISRTAFGKKYSETEKGKKLVMLMSELTELFGGLCVGDFIPWLSWIDRVSGFSGRLEKAAKTIDEVLESVIEEGILETEEEKDGDNFADTLIAAYKDSNSTDVPISKDSVKALLLNTFLGGTDTVSTTLEWTMSELLRHPTTMEKLQKEVRGIVRDKHEISDDYVEKMQYLKAVIKESLRLHPPVPMLVPRIATEDVKIKGFDVLAGTRLMINAWAIGRDPVFWDEPEKFKPERFLDSSRDFKGLDFEFIPFGSGRRGCPGITYAVASLEYTLASLVREFEWTLPNRKEGKDLDMSEHPGFAVCRRFPLLAIASPAII